ncbi:hypothetical protein, partial [Streptomyces albidoflavus]|uniref:hypothetical protein n=1 Tax=Streptomyces albidoflavus TaxID=1886 RepID=UPI001C3EC2B1
ATSARAKLRAARDTQGRKIDTDRASGSLDAIDGHPVIYPMRGPWPVAGTAGGDGVRPFGGGRGPVGRGGGYDGHRDVLTLGSRKL